MKFNFFFKKHLFSSLIALLALTSLGNFAYGQSGAALHFDGSNDYVQIPNVVGGSSFTIEFWMNTNTGGNGGSQWYQGRGVVDAEVGGVVNDFGLSLLNGKMAFGIGNPDVTIQSTSNMTPGWRHIAATWNISNGQMRLYVNGTLEASTNGPVGNPRGVPFIRLGSIAVGGNHSDLTLDELRIWNRVLSQAEIQEKMSCELTTTGNGLNARYGFNQGLAGGSNSGVTTLTDASGNNYHGTLTNFALAGSTSNWVSPGGSLSSTITAGGPTTFACGGSVNLSTSAPIATNNDVAFNGSSTVANCGNGGSVILGGGTIEAWIKTTNAGGSYRGIVVKEFAYGLFMINNQLGVFNWATATPTVVGPTLNDNAWHHVAFTFQNGVPNGSRLYIDGVASGSPFTYNINSQANQLTIGNNGVNPQQFFGEIDEVRVWGTVRTPTEISNNRNTIISPSSSGLAAYYRFDEGSGTSLTDLTSNNNTGTFVNGTPIWNSTSSVAPINYYTYLWSPGGATTSSISATTSGSYTVAVTRIGAGCTSTSAATTVTVSNNTAGAASSNPTLCVNNPLTAITHTTTGATGIGTATGLPSGVTAAWASNTITISGTPTATGTFNYTIPLTGGCGTVNATGTITVNSGSSVGAASSTPTLCTNNPLTPITHTTTGATGIGSATGLPSGVTAAWASNTITISGTPTAAGTFNYSIPLTGGSCSVNATGTITVNSGIAIQSVNASPATVCSGSSSTITIGSSQVGTNYFLRNNSNNAIIAGPVAGTGSAINLNTGALSATTTFNVYAEASGDIAIADRSFELVPFDNGNWGNASGSWTGGGWWAAQPEWGLLATPFNGTRALAASNTRQLLSETFVTGVTYELSAYTYSRNNSPSNTFQFYLYRGNQTFPTNYIVTQSFPASTSSFVKKTLTYTATPADHGQQIGVAFNGSYVDFVELKKNTATCSLTMPTITTVTVTGNTAGAASSNPTLCVNNPLTAITHTTTGATGIGTATGLPSGVTAAWASNTITISGTPTAAGTFNYSIPLTGGSCSVNATGTITVNSGPSVPTITAGGPTTFCSGGSVGLSTASPVNLNKAVNFNGGNQSIVVANPTGINLTNKYTFECYFRTNNPYAHQTLVSKFDDDGDRRSFFINLSEYGNGQLTVCQTSAGTWTNPLLWSSGFLPTAGQWYHIAVVFDGTLGSNHVKLYVDGSLFSQTSWPYTLVPQPTNLYFGGYDGAGNGLNAGANSRFLNGQMDEIRLWNTARTASEVSTNRNVNIAANSTGLVAYYKVNEGTGTTTADATGINANGTLTNGVGWPDVSTAPFSLANPTTLSWTPGGSTLTSITASTAGSYTVAATALGCTSTSAATTVTVNPNVTASVSIAASPSGAISSGTSVTFTATPTNGGTPSYQWKKNGNNVGTNSATYTDAGLANNDVITCIMTSTAPCVTSSPATSNAITMTVGSAIKTWTGTTNSDWATGTNWSPSGAPTSADDILIPNVANDPVIAMGGYCKNITMNAGATLTVNGILIVYGNSVTLNGNTISGVGGQATFNGSNLTGGATFTIDVEFANTNTLIGSADFNFKSTVFITGTLHSFGSNGATAYACFIDDGVQNGILSAYNNNLLGTVKAYRMVTVGGYHFLSSPLNATLSEWADDFSIVGTNGYTNITTTTSPWPTVWSYNEADPSTNWQMGYTSFTSPGNSIAAGVGYAAKFSPTTIEVVGTKRANTFNLPITNTSSGDATKDGWNLLGNPFLSNLDYSEFHATNSSLITPTVYIFKPNGTWATYNALSNTPTNGGGRYIATHQGFFVKKSAVGLSQLSFELPGHGDHMNSPTFHKEEATTLPIVRLSLMKNEERMDECVALMHNKASLLENDNYDSEKLFSEFVDHEIYMTDALRPRMKLSVNTVPSFEPSTIMPIGLKGSGTFEVRVSELANLPLDVNAYLHDSKTNTFIELNLNDDLVLTKNEFESNDGRYSLRFGKFDQAFGADVTRNIGYAYVHDGMLSVTLGNVGSKAEVHITDLAGRHIASLSVEPNTTETLSQISLVPGIYIVSARSAAGNFTNKVLVK